jgi:hypothetical protein
MARTIVCGPLRARSMTSWICSEAVLMRVRLPNTISSHAALFSAHVAKFRLPETEVKETEGAMAADRVQLREEPGGVAVGGEELNDGFEVYGAGLLVEGGALSAAVVEEFLALGGSDELHGSIPVWADPSGPFTESTDRAGSARNRMQFINAQTAHRSWQHRP